MRYRIQLTASEPSARVNLDFDAVAMVVSNPTGSPVYVRIGSNEIPSQSSADWMVSAAQSQCFPVVGRWFGVGLADTSLVQSGSSIVSGLLPTCTITLLDRHEIIPTFGSVNYLSLSTSDLVPFTAFVAGTVSSILDLQAWGGALIYVSPGSTSGQGFLTIEVSLSGTTFQTLASYAIWPGTPIVISVPRVTRYLRISFAATTIPAEPSLTGSYSVRASLNEIPKLDYSPIGPVLSQAFSLATFASSTKILATRNLPAIHVTSDISSGTSPQFSLTLEVSESPTGPWRRIWKRYQLYSVSWPAIDRSVSDMQTYARLTFTNEDAGTLTGTLSFSIRNQPDFTILLERMYQSIGDTTNPQDFDHILGYLTNIYDDIHNNVGAVLTSSGINPSPSSINSSFNVPLAGAAVFTNSGISLTMRSIVTVTVGATVAGQVQLALGNGGAPVIPFYNMTLPANGAVSHRYDSQGTRGYGVPPAFPVVWGYNSAGGQLNVNITGAP